MIQPTSAAALASTPTGRRDLGENLLAKPSGAHQSRDERVQNAEATREAFTRFVGTTVFGQMLSSMRKTVGEPAYFHGGQAEKVFQSQLDQAISDKLTESGASPFAEALFAHQFPHLAELLAEDSATPQAAGPESLEQLATLRRL